VATKKETNGTNRILSIIRTLWPILVLMIGVAAAAGVNVYRIRINEKNICTNSTNIKVIQEEYKANMTKISDTLDDILIEVKKD